jgi:hypothetical protein
MVLTAYGFYVLQMDRNNPSWYYKKINGVWTFQERYGSESVYVRDSFGFKNCITDSKIIFCAPNERNVQPPFINPPRPIGGLYYIDTTLSNNEFKESFFKIYPNPIDDFVNIILKDANQKIQSITIYDTFGRQLISVNKHLVGLVTTSLPYGIYLLEITLENNLKSTQKIIKK